MEKKKKKRCSTLLLTNSKAVCILQVIISSTQLKFHEKLIHNANFLAKKSSLRNMQSHFSARR